ncbi:hypothetical protein [Pseudorhodoferax soli]|uniref:hypothetical protein n=1 Tax=Pseudorhodoferax soli TaxID=545864 RepID=UPI0014734FB9|nr:hypothetical protein [Pseudorhodoferax soli]
MRTKAMVVLISLPSAASANWAQPASGGTGGLSQSVSRLGRHLRDTKDECDGIGRAALASSYENAFRSMLLMMTGITVASAAIVFLFLAKPKQKAVAMSATAAD